MVWKGTLTVPGCNIILARAGIMLTPKLDSLDRLYIDPLLELQISSSSPSLLVLSPTNLLFDAGGG